MRKNHFTASILSATAIGVLLVIITLFSIPKLDYFSKLYNSSEINSSFGSDNSSFVEELYDAPDEREYSDVKGNTDRREISDGSKNSEWSKNPDENKNPNVNENPNVNKNSDWSKNPNESNTGKTEYARCIDGRSEQIIEHTGYTVSYNGQWNLPNWVAYELTADETRGDVERSNNFTADPYIVGDAVISSDYTRSGYDRGHMAPAADMKWSEQAMTESFYMSNICPQNHNMNAGDWKDLEEFARDLAACFGSVYICCGPIVTGKDISTIGNERKIRVPSAFFKAFLRRKSDNSWCAIGFIMPNMAGNKPLLSYVVTIDDIEKKTGIDLFFNLPDSIENAVEADYNIKDWSLRR